MSRVRISVAVGILTAYKDVQQAGVNPLVHFLKYGQPEGREVQQRQANQIRSSQFAEIEQTTQMQPRSFLKLIGANLNKANYILKTFGLV